jgi:YesN/AraC family two-component response regulator
MNHSIAKSNQAGIEFVISMNEELQEEVMFLSDDFPISMYTQNFQHAASDYIPLHWHNELQMTWVFEGELEYYIDGDRFKLTSDKIIFVNSNQLHSSKTINRDAKTLCINFTLDFFHPLTLEKYILPLIKNHSFSYHLLKLKPYRVAHLEKFLNWKNETIGYFSVMNFLSQTFEDILDEFENIENKKYDEEIDIFQNMISFVHNNYSDQLTVNEIAVHALINKNRCTSIFKKYTKMSPIKYLNSYRLYIAKNMIIHTDKPISEISADVGYNQISYFIEQFRSNYGLSPLKYRNKFGGDSNKSF